VQIGIFFFENWGMSALEGSWSPERTQNGAADLHSRGNWCRSTWHFQRRQRRAREVEGMLWPRSLGHQLSVTIECVLHGRDGDSWEHPPSKLLQWAMCCSRPTDSHRLSISWTFVLGLRFYKLCWTGVTARVAPATAPPLVGHKGAIRNLHTSNCQLPS
jgi:hypothetical protein